MAMKTVSEGIVRKLACDLRDDLDTAFEPLARSKPQILRLRVTQFGELVEGYNSIADVVTSMIPGLRWNTADGKPPHLPSLEKIDIKALSTARSWAFVTLGILLQHPFLNTVKDITRLRKRFRDAYHSPCGEPLPFRELQAVFADALISRLTRSAIFDPIMVMPDINDKARAAYRKAVPLLNASPTAIKRQNEYSDDNGHTSKKVKQEDQDDQPTVAQATAPVPVPEVHECHHGVSVGLARVLKEDADWFSHILLGRAGLRVPK